MPQYQRTRSKEDRRVEPAYVDWKPPDNPGSFNIPNGSTQVGVVKTIHDNVTKGFRSRRKAGETIMNDVLLERHTISSGQSTLVCYPYSGGHRLVLHGNYGYLFLGAAPRPGLPLEVDQDYIGGLVLTDAYAKAKQSVVMGGEILSDFAQTVGMLRRPFAGARELIKKMGRYRAGRMGKTAASFARANANAWLEYRYGWQPILIDGQSVIKESCSVYNRAVARILVARAGTRERGAKTLPWYNVNADGIMLSGSTEVSEELRISAGVRYRMKPEDAASYAMRVTGTRLADLPVTLWELVPYSFVADWFVNVGSFLQATAPLPGFESLGNWVSGVHIVRTKISGTWTYSPGGTTFTSSFSPVTDEINNYARAVNQEVPPIQVAKSLALSRLHTVDALALSAEKILSGIKDFKH